MVQEANDKLEERLQQLEKRVRELQMTVITSYSIHYTKLYEWYENFFSKILCSYLV